MSRADAVAGIRVGAAFAAGMTGDSLRAGIKEAYSILDAMDHGLMQKGYPRFAKLVELANLSSVVGNCLAEGIVKNSEKVFTRAGAHKYQDLRANPSVAGADNIEIKMALGKNKPKGHLAKGGHYLTCRYVLGDHTGAFTPGVHGDVVWIWEIRLGLLSDADFSISNTEGDSGKTAVVTSDAFKRLKLVYLDEKFFPFANMKRYLAEYATD